MEDETKKEAEDEPIETETGNEVGGSGAPIPAADEPTPIPPTEPGDIPGQGKPNP